MVEGAYFQISCGVPGSEFLTRNPGNIQLAGFTTFLSLLPINNERGLLVFSVIMETIRKSGDFSLSLSRLGNPQDRNSF